MIRYDPARMLGKIAPDAKIEKLLSGRVTLKRSALKFASKIEGLNSEKIAEVALDTIKGYKRRVKADSSVKAEILEDPKQLIQRVQNEVIFQVSEKIKSRYAGEFYIWLPSDAEEPRPEHQLNYGLKFQVGVGEQPGDDYGCRCGMEILVDDTQLDL